MLLLEERISLCQILYFFQFPHTELMQGISNPDHGTYYSCTWLFCSLEAHDDLLFGPVLIEEGVFDGYVSSANKSVKRSAQKYGGRRVRVPFLVGENTRTPKEPGKTALLLGSDSQKDEPL